MNHKLHEIVICLGSSCFARGNKKTLGLIQQYLQDNDLLDSVSFRGNHCFGKCHNGPILKINDHSYEGINESEVLAILEKEIGSLKE